MKGRFHTVVLLTVQSSWCAFQSFKTFYIIRGGKARPLCLSFADGVYVTNLQKMSGEFQIMLMFGLSHGSI